jgi:hypothetical protein
MNVIHCMDNNKCMVLINIDLLSGAHSMKVHSEKTTSSRELANVQHRWGHISLVHLLDKVQVVLKFETVM